MRGGPLRDPWRTTVGGVLPLRKLSPGDRLAAGGNTTITVMGGEFFQHVAGGDTPPNSILCGVFPDLCYDTFVTNKFLFDDNGEILVMPDFVMTSNTINGGSVKHKSIEDFGL